MAARAALGMAAALLLAGCAGLRRGGEDAAVVATWPIHVVTTPAGMILERWEEDPRSTAATAPFLVPLFMAGDTVLTGVSAVDAAFLPVYAGADVRPLGLYEFDGVLPRVDEEKGTKALGCVFIVPVTVAGLFAHGNGCARGLYGRPWWP